MTAPLYIALRFATHRKRALLLSMVGVVFGVGIFICTQAQTQGFAQFFINSTIGSNGALVLRSRFQPRYEGMVVSAKSANADLYGIEPTPHLRTTELAKQIVDGSFDDFRNNTTSVIVGYRLADLLEVKTGDTIQLLSPGGEYWRFTVAAIARSGVSTIDTSRVYAHARVAQRLLKKSYEASMIIYKLRDPDRAPSLATHFENLFQHTAQSWQEREEGNLQIFSTLRMSAAITVSLIILLAGFGIFNVLTMSVLSKVREIAILRSMGYRRIDISAIFLWQGALIAGIGSVIGCVLGALLTWGISHVPIRIRGLLYTNHFLVVWDWRHYFWATVLAIIAVFIASYVPAHRAAQLQPVDTLRGSSL